MRRLLRHTLLTAGFSLSIGCSSLPVVSTPMASLETADARVRAGCYDCLLEAARAYRALVSTGLSSVALRRLFEVELLVAVRERELALDAEAAIGRAAELARALPPAAEADRYLAVVEALPHERNGWPRRELQAFRRNQAMSAARAAEEVAWLREGPLGGQLNEYLATATECTYGLRGRPAQVSAPPVAGPADPANAASLLVRFRRAICGGARREALEAIRAAEPAFVETSLFLGQLAVAAIADGGSNPHLLVDEALSRFPESPAVTFLAASLQHVVAAWERALVHYDQTLALKPAHEEAWLGRTIALTELRRHEQAVDAATRMISLDLDNLDQAYYWRAYNRHVRAELTAARTDIDAARARRVSEDILTLAGIVEHDQDDLELADRDLRRARDMGRGRNCRAEWYLGSVFVKQRAWTEAAWTFEAAMRCYADDVSRREGLVRSLAGNSSLDPVYRTSRIATLEEEVRIQRRQQRTAAFNAANFHVHSGDLERARPLVEIASEDPELSAEVAELRRHLTAAASSRRAGGS
jgi:tetratricopeptide (TPR) repeat protein